MCDVQYRAKVDVLCNSRLSNSVVCILFFLYEKGNGDGQTTTIEMEWNAKLGDGSFSVNTICGLASCFVHVVVVGLFMYDDDCCRSQHFPLNES